MTQQCWNVVCWCIMGTVSHCMVKIQILDFLTFIKLGKGGLNGWIIPVQPRPKPLYTFDGASVGCQEDYRSVVKQVQQQKHSLTIWRWGATKISRLPQWTRVVWIGVLKQPVSMGRVGEKHCCAILFQHGLYPVHTTRVHGWHFWHPHRRVVCKCARVYWCVKQQPWTWPEKTTTENTGREHG